MKASLQTHFEQYISYCTHTKGLRTETLRSYQQVFATFRNLMPEVKSVEELSPCTMDTFFHRLQTRTRKIGKDKIILGVKASTVRTYGSKLHSFFDWLCARGYLKNNPVIQHTLPKPDYSDKRALQRHEIERIAAAITQHSLNSFLYKRNMAILQVFVFCGLRRTELLSLRVMDVDLHKKILTVNGETSKSKFTRKMPLTPIVSLHLEEYIAERKKRSFKSEYLWMSYPRSERFTTHGLKHWVDKIRDHSGIDFHVHRFRHSFACMLGRNNVSAVKIQQLLGHTDLRMTQTYLRSLGVEDVRDSVELLSLANL